VEYFNRSLLTPSDDTYLRSLNYETLGNIYFDEANYKLAGAYFDSTLTQLPENSRAYRFVKKKRDNLEDVIYYENIADLNDSILYLVKLSDAERLDYFTEYTDRLKEEARKTMLQAATQ